MIKGTESFERSKQIIKENPIFSNLKEETIENLLTYLEYKKWNKGAEFFNTSDTVQQFYIILSGRIKTYQINHNTGREITVFLLQKHDVFDIISLLDQKQRSTNFKALDNAEVLSAPMNFVRDWIEQNPEINKTLLPYLGTRMRMLEETLADNVLEDIPTRLAKLIVRNINHTTKQLQLINDLPDNEIAGLIGSTRAVVNRHIQNFKKSGILEESKRQKQILNLEKLLKQIDLDFD